MSSSNRIRILYFIMKYEIKTSTKMFTGVFICETEVSMTPISVLICKLLITILAIIDVIPSAKPG